MRPKQELKVFIDNVEPELSTWSLVGGSVVFTTAPSSGSKIVLKRATKLERTTNYSSINNSIRPETINKDFDRVWYALQDQSYKLGQYDLDYAYAVNTSNQAKQIAQNAHQRADDAYDLADTTNTEIRDISRGGTGADNAADARTNLEIYSQAEVDALIASGGAGNIVAIGGGGTGGTTAEEARTNLDVLSKTETNTAITNSTKQATESVKGQAKIATTAIAQAGTNDTDFLTAKKLRDALNAEGDAPVFGFRALVTFNAKTTPPTILRSKNVLSVTQNATGDWTITFETALPNNNYGVFGICTDGVSGQSSFKVRSSTNDSAGEPMLKTTNQVRVAYGFVSSFISVGVV